MVTIEASAPVPPLDGGVPGGRLVGGDGINLGALRCPRCTARLVSKKATLVEKEVTLHQPWPDAQREAKNAAGDMWDEKKYSWWWRLVDHTDFDQCAVSHFHDTPRGKLRYMMCPECMFGPLGFQMESDPEVLVICDQVNQQDFALCNDATDFKAPAGMDVR